MDSNKLEKETSKKDPKVSQKLGREYLLRGVLFFFLFFFFLRKVILVNKNDLKLEKNFGAYHGRPSTNRIKGKPFKPDAYSLRFDFASEESGTKIIAYSKSLTNLWNILDRDTDTYMLAPCQTTDWFVLSFPESILIQEISFLSYEFYASSYKNIRISVSNVYPSNKWLTLSEIETEPSTDEIFDLSVVCNTDQNDCWGKYLKVELLDYHRVEDNYYCSITKMVIYGITAVEYLESEIVDDKSLYESFQSQTNVKYEGLEEDKVNRFTEIARRVPEPPKLSSEYPSSLSLNDSKSDSDKFQLDKLSSLETFPKSSTHLSPTFIYDMKKTVINLFYKFLMELALRVDSDFHNKKLVYRILKIAKFKKYCGTNLLFQFNCNRFMTYLLLEKYSPYYANILNFVRLPLKHTWFESVLFDFVKNKRHLVDKIINDVGIKEVPILVCIEYFGVLTRYRCFFYFNLKSFSTLLFSRYTQGFKFSKLLMNRNNSKDPNKTNDCYINLLNKLYFYYPDGRIVIKKSKTKIKGLIDGDDGLINRYDYPVQDDYVSMLTVVGNLMYVAMTDASLFFGPFDSDFNYPNLKKDLVETEVSLYRAELFKNIARYLQSRKKYYSLKDNFTKNKTRLDDKHHEEHDMVDHEELTKKDTKAHKHVLLKLSERIKSLEYLTNKMSNKIYEIEKLLNITLQQHYKANQDKFKFGSDFRLNKVMNVLGINRFKIVSKTGLKFRMRLNYMVSSSSLKNYYYKRLKKYSNYEIGYLYIRSEDSVYFNRNLCKLSRCVPYNKRCRRLYYQYHLNKSNKFFIKHKLIKCMISHGCRSTSFPQHPHFVNPGEHWLLISDFEKYNKYILLFNNILYLFKLKLSAYFNIYTFFVLFLFTQIFWICKYNSHSKKIKKLLLLQKA